MQNSRCVLTKRAVVLNICTLNFIAYFYFMQIFIPLRMTHNSRLHYSRPNYVSSTFKVGQGEWPIISGQRWHMSNYELVFPYRIWLLLLVTIILCNFYATVTLCMTLNCALTTVITLAACSKWGKRERPLFSGHMWYVSNLELVFPSR